MLYFYDPQGQRVGKQQGDALEDYVYDPQGHIISVHDGVGNLLRAELYTPEGRHVATWNSSGQYAGLSFNHADWLGTERVRTDSNGAAFEWCTDTPYGMNLTCTNPSADTSPMHFTGKQRDYESGLDDFGARYFGGGNSLGRFMSPDPLMASAKVWDPQTWNRYSYARNNPLAFVDPSGMDEVTAQQCVQDKNCVTVNVNVIYDKNANNGQGLTAQQKSDFKKGQLQDAKDEYGNADIHLNVTYTAGAVSSTDDGKLSVSGLKAGSLNLVVTDQVASSMSGMAGKTAVSFINANSTNEDDVAHEMAHQFMGDTRGAMNWISTHDPTSMSAAVFDAFADIANDSERSWMRNLDSHSGPFSYYPLASAFHHNAAVFQQYIQPTTKPK